MHPCTDSRPTRRLEELPTSAPPEAAASQASGDVIGKRPYNLQAGGARAPVTRRDTHVREAPNGRPNPNPRSRRGYEEESWAAAAVCSHVWFGICKLGAQQKGGGGGAHCACASVGWAAKWLLTRRRPPHPPS
jgi:hypothetical protein